MKLSQYISEYRSSHGYSQRQFAKICNLSNGYISMLEKEFNPKTKEPVQPSIPVLRKIAIGMGITLSDLLNEVDDILIDISVCGDDEKAIPGIEDDLDAEFVDLFLQLTDAERSLIIAQIKGILANR